MGKRVVILGGGFGGFACARGLAGADLEVVLVDKENHFLFQPLLYQVATAGLSPANIAWPIRSLLWRQKNATVLMERVVGVDTSARVVNFEDGNLPYDFLVVATGATHGYFGHDEWEQNAGGLKTLADATSMRSKILLAFEEAEATDDPREREALLTIVIVGGGPTGVEMAGSVAELAKRTLAKDFRRIDPTKARIILVEGRSVLAEFPERLGKAATDSLRSLGVEVKIGEFVEGVGPDGVTLASEFIPSRTVVWAAGVKASEAGNWLAAPTDNAGRILVDDHCRVPGHEGAYAIGDVAAFMDDANRRLPGTCPVAMQQGGFVAKMILGRDAGPFRYKDKGILATIGRSKAVAKIGRFEFTGFVAWCMWMGLHLWQLLSGQSKVIVFIQWVWAYLAFDRGARLITQSDDLPEHSSARRR